MVDTVSGGEHNWVLNTDTNVNTSEEVWAFLKNFTLKGNTGNKKTSSLAEYKMISVCYSSGIVYLQGVKENCTVSVVDTKGRLVASTSITQSRFAFVQKSGVYIVKVTLNDRSVAIKMVVP